MDKQNQAIRLRAGCKVNLFLDILSRRQDGYHEIKSLFYPLPEPHDSLTITPLPAGRGLVVECNARGLEGPDNTLAKAYRTFGQATGIWPDLHIRLDKAIPMGAGLGGGSSDAAVLLHHLAKSQTPGGISVHDLLGMAGRVGADVPFFLSGQPAWVEGIGDRVTPVTVDLGGLFLLLVCPGIHVSTAWAYAAWDRLYGAAGSFVRLTRSGGKSRNPRFRMGCLLKNSFESVVFPEFPVLNELKRSLLSQGAAGCVLSGSGASLCALFRSGTLAQKVLDRLADEGTPSFLHPL